MPYPWFKFYGAEYLSDVKMRSLSPCARSCWITLLSFASVASTPGIVPYLTEDALMREAGLDPMRDEWNQTEGVLKLFVARKMIKIEDSVIHILNWGKRQESYLTDAERASRYRHTKVTPTSRQYVSKVTLDKDKEADIDIENTFSLFWSAYPRKVAKKPALKAWSRVVQMTKPEVIMLGLEKSKKSSQWSKDEGQFIPHAATWLNAERWNDEVGGAIIKKTDKI